jgi:hypothetical protein
LRPINVVKDGALNNAPGPGAGGTLLRAWLIRLLVVSTVVMMMVMVAVVVMAVDNHHNLRLRRVRNREAKDKSQREQNLFHTQVSCAARLFTELL